MDARAGVVLAALPRLLGDLLHGLLARDPRVRLLGRAADARQLQALLRSVSADVVLLGAHGPALPPDVLALLDEFPRVTFLALPRGGGAAYLSALRLWTERLDDPGPESLVRAIVEAAGARAVFPRAVPAPEAGGGGASAADGGTGDGGGSGEGVGPTAGARGSRSFSEDVDLRVHSAAAAPRATLPLQIGPGPPGAPAAPAIVPAPPPPMPTAATDAFNQAVTRLLTQLSTAAVLPAPPSNASVVSAAERSVGIGRFVGTPGPTEFAAEEVLGGRVEAVVRFELWDAALAPLHAETAALQARLRNEHDALRALGFLKLRLAGTSPADPVGASWRQASLYEALYEYEYQDPGASQSLLVQVIADFVGEHAERMVVRGDMARWDNVEAPVLTVRGPARIHALSTLSFVPGATPLGKVRLLRTFDGATGPPAKLTLAEFQTDATGPAPLHRHARTTFSTLDDLFNQSKLGDPVKLGDWDEDGATDLYQVRRLVFATPIELAHSGERFVVRHQNPKLDQTAVVYLRAGP